MQIGTTRWPVLVSFALGMLILFGAAGRAAEQKDIVDTALSSGQFKTLVTAVTAAGLAETLKGEGPFTVFAPTDAAFAKLPAGTVEDLLKPENKAKLTAILTYHVVGAKVMSSDLLVGPESTRTASGADLPISYALCVNAVPVVQADIKCSNGVIHVIDEVLLPPDSSKPDIVETAVAAGQFRTLVAAIEAADLVDVLKSAGPFTVFAPTDDAFAKLPDGMLRNLLRPTNRSELQGILKYHVVPGKVMAADVAKMASAKTLQGEALGIKVAGGRVMIGNANAVKTDIVCSNGIVHVIDGVLVPPTDTAKPADIADTAAAAGQFKTLVAAVEAAGLVDTLKGTSPLTVFAPTDEAFAKLPAGTVEELLKPQNKDKLQAILTYHVVPGRIMSSDLLGIESTGTVGEGMPLSFSLTVKPGGATVTNADIVCSNGVIHVIDTVMMP